MRKLTCVLAEAIKIPGVSRSLSLIAFGSSTKALFGGESGEAVEVTQSGAGPEAFVAVHPAGSAGATTLSNFSTKLVQSGPPACVAPVEISHAPRPWVATPRMCSVVIELYLETLGIGQPGPKASPGGPSVSADIDAVFRSYI